MIPLFKILFKRFNMFVFEINSVEANRTIVNSIDPDDGQVVELKYLPKNIGFDEWSKYNEIRVVKQFEVDFSVIVPIVFAVHDGEVVDARVLIVEAL